MDEVEFSHLALKTLFKIVETIEAADTEGLIDIDFNSDIITLTTDKGIFVINKHSAAKEIWLASPISGPYHFFYNLDEWRSRDGKEILDILTKELNIDFKRN